MKIGQVVRQYGITSHSLYFYINNGLLVPPRRNNQYVFDQHTLEELEMILKLKEMEFPLKTIHRVLSLRRISNFYAREDREELKNIYLEQDRLLEGREADLREARRKLAAELDRCEQGPGQGGRQRTGVPVRMLPMLRCPECGGELLLEDVVMSPRYIFQGKLTCQCGYCAAIRDGVVETGNVNESLFDRPDVTRRMYRNLPSETLSLFEQSYRWLEDSIRENAGEGKVWLESYVNAWFFFHNHLELLREEDSLVVIDKFPETLRAYKDIIEWAGAPCSILYIADSSFHPPLKKGVIDCSMDFFAVNEHNFYHEGLFLNQLIPYLRKGAEAFGVYFFFEDGETSVRKLMHDYPEFSRYNFNIHWFTREMDQHFRLLETEDCGSASVSGDNLGLGFQVPGDTLHLQAYHGRLRGDGGQSR